MATTRDLERLVRNYIEPKMHDNIFDSTQVLKYYKRFAKVRPYTDTIEVPLEYVRGVGGTYLDLGILDRSRKEITQKATYYLSDSYVALTVSWRDKRNWTTPEAVVDGLQAKARNAQKTMAYNLTTMIVSGQEAITADGYEIIGLDVIMNSTADQTLGGLTTTNVPTWDNQTTDAESGVPQISAITEFIAKCSDGAVSPDAFITDKFIKAYIQGTALQPQERYTTGKFLMGEDLPVVVGVPMLVDAQLESSGDTGGNMYAVNKESLYMGIHSKDNMKYWPPMRPADQFAFSSYWTFAGQLLTAERRRLGVYHSIAGVL